MLSQFTPIWGNSDFTPGKQDMGFKIWANKGLSKIADLFDHKTLMSFESLKQKHDIQPKHFFKYLQIRNYIFQIQKVLSLPNLTSIEEIAKKSALQEGIDLYLYNNRGWFSSFLRQ